MEKVPAEFLEEAIHDLSEILEKLRRIASAAETSLPSPDLQKLLQTLYTIKGSVRIFGLDDEAKLAHNRETFVTGSKHKSWISPRISQITRIRISIKCISE